MYKSLILLSSIFLSMKKSSACTVQDLRDYQGCYGQTFSPYYLDAYGYQSSATSTNNGHSTHCYGYEACQGSTMTYNSGFSCYGYRSCANAEMKGKYALCNARQSCQGSTITQTANGHPVTCSGRLSCSGAAIYGPEGLYVDFTGGDVRDLCIAQYIYILTYTASTQ